MIALPVDWNPTGPQFPDAFDMADLVVAPNSPDNLFREPTLNRYHVDSASTISDQFSDYIDGICDAICHAIEFWMNTTVMAGIIIIGPVGTVLPGCLVGPPLGSLILASAPLGTLQETRYSMAIADAFGLNWMMKCWRPSR